MSKELEALFKPKKGIIQNLYPYYNKHIGGILGDFYEKYCDDFYNATEEKEEEHRLEWSFIHKDFETLLEEFIASFLKENNYTEAEWVKEMTKTHDTEDNKTMFNIIAARQDYETFVEIEASSRVKNCRVKREAEGKEGKIAQSPSRRRNKNESKMRDVSVYEGKTRRAK